MADIKAVKKRKEKLKDLEGMDTSNIIVESTGRPRRAAASANNFFAPKPSKPIDLGEEDEDEDDDEEQESDSEEGISYAAEYSCPKTVFPLHQRGQTMRSARTKCTAKSCGSYKLLVQSLAFIVLRVGMAIC